MDGSGYIYQKKCNAEKEFFKESVLHENVISMG